MADDNRTARLPAATRWLPFAPASTPVLKKKKKGDKMAATLNQSSENTFLSLRARLRTPECASQHFAERVAKATLFDGPKFQEHLQLDLLKVLTAHRNPEKQQSKGSQDETYTLLEQLASMTASYFESPNGSANTRCYRVTRCGRRKRTPAKHRRNSGRKRSHPEQD